MFTLIGKVFGFLFLVASAILVTLYLSISKEKRQNINEKAGAKVTSLHNSCLNFADRVRNRVQVSEAKQTA